MNGIHTLLYKSFYYLSACDKKWQQLEITAGWETSYIVVGMLAI